LSRDPRVCGIACDGVHAGFPEDRFAAISPAFVRFSSGTTGRSKGVLLSHRSLRERIESANAALCIGPEDRVLWTLPMAHHFAVSIVLYLYFGATTVVETARMGADILATAEASGATVVYGSPFHHGLLAADTGTFRWPSLRLAVSTAAALRSETAAAFLARFGQPLVQALGVIECGLPLVNRAASNSKPAAVGRALPGWEVSLRDDAGNEAGAGMLGELHLRGPGMFDAYLNPWQERAEVAPGGWFATGDLAVKDEDGDVFLRGRSKSVINVGGMKVFPEEVEAVLLDMPGVARCRVSGREHPVFGAVPVADIVTTAAVNIDAAAVRAHCRERLAAHKVPVAVRIVGEIPLTASGKVKR
jgi:acyl-coenzyme A synthetase/AMP-(fatty) acid ligase